MKKQNGHEDLLKDLFDDSGDFRDATLKQGLLAVRRERRLRMISRAVAVLVGLTLVSVMIERQLRHSISRQPVQEVGPAKVIPGTDIRVLSDEELLAFFKGRPVGLVGPPENQRLVFFDQASN